MTPDFTQLNSLFETMQDEANQLYSAMTGVAALLILGSLIARASQAESNPAQLVRSIFACLLYTSPSPRDLSTSRMPSSA